MKFEKLAVLFGLSLAFASWDLGVHAQDDLDEEEDEDDVHILTNMPLEADYVTVAHKFSDEPAEGLVMGELVSVVVGVINSDPNKEINVTSAMGSLNHPQDFSIYVANFSQQMFNSITIPPGQEGSFTYNFYAPSALQVDFHYQMALTIFYEDDVRGIFACGLLLLCACLRCGCVCCCWTFDAFSSLLALFYFV